MLTGRCLTRRTAAVLVLATGLFAGFSSATAFSETVSAPSEAFNEALAAYDAAWDANGLAFAVATFTEEGGGAYGQYTPRSDSVFQNDEVLSIYAEPIGYAYNEADGQYEFELTASYRLLTLSGQVLAEQDNFAVFAGKGRSKQRELAAALSFQFSGLPAGDYELETLFTDGASGKEAGFTLPFRITAPN